MSTYHCMVITVVTTKDTYFVFIMHGWHVVKLWMRYVSWVAYGEVINGVLILLDTLDKGWYVFLLIMLSISPILLNGLWCWKYSLFAHMLLMHVYATYGVVVQEIDIVAQGMCHLLYTERVCWPSLHEVKGMSCFIAKIFLLLLLLSDALSITYLATC